MRFGACWILLCLLVLSCAPQQSADAGGGAAPSPDASASASPGSSPSVGAADEDAGLATAGSDGFVCPPGGIRGSGSHRLFTQGNEGEADAFGVYSLMHPWGADGSDFELCSDARFLGANDLNMDGAYQPGEEPLPLGPPGIVHGEHFLVGVGAFAEFSAVLCDDITGNVTFYIPNYDESGSRAAHQLFVVHEGKETLIAETVDEEAGQSGYNPFVRQLRGTDPQAEPGDTLLLRSTNLNGIPFSVMVWRPPSEYESWIMVEVP